LPWDAYSEVPYPPPPARVEVVPPAPRKGLVWVDGQWAWAWKRWQWEAGGWVAAPPGATFARWATVRLDDGRLFFAPAAWRARDGHVLAPPPMLERARTAGYSAEDE
jgi:hypothetical protein